jgi:hypothetical protein
MDFYYCNGSRHLLQRSCTLLKLQWQYVFVINIVNIDSLFFILHCLHEIHFLFIYIIALQDEQRLNDRISFGNHCNQNRYIFICLLCHIILRKTVDPKKHVKLERNKIVKLYNIHVFMMFS